MSHVLLTILLTSQQPGAPLGVGRVRDDLTHASWFSGAGGLDLGLERAGWRTVSFSEIDPYASAVLAQRWPGVPNLGDITGVAGRSQSNRRIGANANPRNGHDRAELGNDWHAATLWTGGFPCQDLSVAGKRRGMGEGTRSGLAYTYLDLVGRHRPRFVLLENVPGLLSSHGGRDMAALLGALVELGYGVGYRMLDARYFGVPQRRRRVFILGDALGGRAGAERAAEVLSVGSRCRWHPPTGVEAGPLPSGRTHGGPVGTLREHVRPGSNTDHTVVQARPLDDARGQAGWREGSAAVGGREPDPGDRQRPDPVRRSGGAEADPGRNRTPDELARRLDDRDGVAVMENQRGELRLSEQSDSVKVGGGKPGQGYQAVLQVAATLNSGGNSGGFRTEPGEHLTVVTGTVADSDYLPIGLDSHRYRCCGNGVVSNVSEWIGTALREALEAEEVAA